MPDFSARSAQRERLDEASLTLPEYRAYLASLERTNRASFAYAPVLSWLEHELRGLAPGTSLRLTDAGCGQGGLLRAVWRRFGGRGLRLELLGVDLNPWAAPCAEGLTPEGAPIRYETADIFARPALLEADYVVSSLLAHHLTDAQIVVFLHLMEDKAARGWLISDLHRHPLAYHAARWGLALLQAHPLVREDGPVSFLRAFVRADWERLLAQAGLAPGLARVSWRFPFRYVVTRSKAHPPKEAA